jgi:phospholipid transport system substrate-binding protein
MSNSLVGRRFLVRFAAGAILAGPSGSRAQDFAQVASPIQRLYGALLTIMKAGAGVPFMQRYDQLLGPVSQALDLPAILQVAVGPAWSAVPGAQQAALQSAFQDYTVATYVSQFESYAGERFDVLPGLRNLPNGNRVLSTKIIGGDGEAHALDYVMHPAGGAWKAVDVLLEGSISRVAVLRSDFRRLFAKGGSTELANYLRQKATDLAGSTSPP